MPGFLLHVGATVLCAARRPGAADRTEPARDGEWSANGHAGNAIRSRWLHAAAAARRQRALCDRPVDHRGDTRHIQRAAAPIAGQPGDLRAHWHAARHCHDTDTRHRILSEVGHEHRLSLPL